MRKESLNGLQELTGMDRRTIKPRLAKLSAEKGAKGALMYWTREALPLIYSQDGGVYETDKERARLLHHQANIAALDEKVKEKTLIPYDVVVDRWTFVLSNFRAKALAIPSTLAASCANAPRDQVQKKADELVKQMLEELVADVEY